MAEPRQTNNRSPARGSNPAARSYAGRQGGALAKELTGSEADPQFSKSFVNQSTGGVSSATEEIFPSLIQT